MTASKRLPLNQSRSFFISLQGGLQNKLERLTSSRRPFSSLCACTSWRLKDCQKKKQHPFPLRPFTVLQQLTMVSFSSAAPRHRLLRPRRCRNKKKKHHQLCAGRFASGAVIKTDPVSLENLRPSPHPKSFVSEL